MEIEEKNFKLTNAFTTADSRSPLKISEDYRYIQQHYRAAAARAHKKMHGKCYSSPVPFHEHTMVRCKTQLNMTGLRGICRGPYIIGTSLSKHHHMGSIVKSVFLLASLTRYSLVWQMQTSRPYSTNHMHVVYHSSANQKLLTTM